MLDRVADLHDRPHAEAGRLQAREQRKMKNIVSMDPFRCRMWELHDRMDMHIDEHSCRAEIASIDKHGQLVPVLGRPLRNDPDHAVELIYGARRLFIARYLRRPILVELRDIPDEEGIVAMDIENRHRRDISPYERGMSYLKWLRHGFFKSQDEVARAFKISPSQISRLLKLAQLPAVVIGAFPSPVEICETWALDLAAALEDPERRGRTCARARALAAQPTRLSARETFRELVAAGRPGRKVRAKPRDDVVTGRDGRPLFRIRHQASSVSILITVDKLSADRLTKIKLAVVGTLEEPATGASRYRALAAPEPLAGINGTTG